MQPTSLIESPAVKDLLDQAMQTAAIPLDPKAKYRLIIKSISEKQRSRQPAPKKLAKCTK